MTNRITLPGDIPGLLRRGSPHISAMVPGCGGVVLNVHPTRGADVVWRGPDSECDEAERGVPLTEIALDLHDATGRAHAVWWLAGIGAAWGCVDKHQAGLWLASHAPRSGIHARRFTAEAPKNSSIPKAYLVVPSLTDLNPNDPRTLEDGSRAVDAEALRRVVLHVAGREG